MTNGVINWPCQHLAIRSTPISPDPPLSHQIHPYLTSASSVGEDDTAIPGPSNGSFDSGVLGQGGGAIFCGHQPESEKVRNNTSSS